MLPSPAEQPYEVWRLDVLIELGLDYTLSVEAALNKEIDLHRFAALVKAGCNPTTAYDILR